MASLIPGYEYDIFISYRQKDNKYDRWVTVFVDNLKKELEATFKEEITVYFDINPHDGLLETHDVDESLKEKLKCLVFIPIISRTYCDPKSFAWVHEFNAFIEQVSNDQFGLKVKLPNGNVASRILPVQIHELDLDDRKLVESELGGFLRGIEFIYKEPGVNKPLTSDDDENKNLNGTKYRIQVNKVANAIKEIIIGLKAESAVPSKEKSTNQNHLEEVSRKEIKKVKSKPGKLSPKKLLYEVVITAILIFAALFAIPRIFKHDTLEKLRSTGERITVAVLPFQNMTNDTSWNIWQDGIQNELITYLTNFNDLRVMQTGSINGLLHGKGLVDYASLTPSRAIDISRVLEANVYISGAIKQAGDNLRINAHIIESTTEEVLKSFQVNGRSDRVLALIDSLSILTKNFLIVSKLENEIQSDFRKLVSTNSSEAYKYFVLGYNAYYKYDNAAAINFLSQAVKLDSNFTAATVWLCCAYLNQGIDALENKASFDQAKNWALRAYDKRDRLPLHQKIYAEMIYASCFKTPYETIKCFRQLQEIDGQSPNVHFEIGFNYSFMLEEYDKAIPEFEKAFEIYKKWGIKPPWIFDYELLGVAYYKTGQYKKAEEIIKQAEIDFPETGSNIFYWEIYFWRAIISLAQNDSTTANQYIAKYLFLRKENADPEELIYTGLANLYSLAGIQDKAEEYYRKATDLQPNSPFLINNLAFFMIDNNKNIDEALILADKALKMQPDNYAILDTKGWGLYKQGKYKQALVYIQKADSLKPIYNHGIYTHLEAAKKAVADQKQNN